MLVKTKGFAGNPFEAIALDSELEVFFCGNQTHSGLRGSGYPPYQKQVRRVADLDVNVVKDPGVISGIQKTLLAFKRLAIHAAA